MIESARILSRYCDVYKAEFPGTLGVETDAQLLDNLKKLNDACVKPWVLLSAGVDYPQYKKQVEMAMKAGAQRRARRPGVLEGVLHLRDAGGAAEVRRDRVRPPGARRSDAIVKTGTPVVRQVRAHDWTTCTASARPKAGTPATAAAPGRSGAGQAAATRRRIPTRCIDLSEVRSLRERAASM